MKKGILTISVLVLVLACKSITKKNINKQIPKETLTENMNEPIFVTALFYLKDGQESLFEEYKSKVNTVFQENEAELTKIIKPLKLLKGNMKLPDEIHFGYFKNMEQLEKTGADPAYQDLVNTLRNPYVERLEIILSKKVENNIQLEKGDHSKFYAITILDYKEDTASKEIFLDYLNKSCAIMPEFGAHFEQFLSPFQVKGSMQKPDRVHLFYMNDMKGFKLMSADDRMQALYPLRDQSVNNANLILGKAL